MTKRELVEYIHQQVGLPKTLIGEFVETTFEIIKNTLKQGKAVKIVRFGKWEPVLRRGKQIRHPVSKQIIQIPEHKSVAFRPSPCLKNKI